MTNANEEGTLGYTDREHLPYAADRDWTILTFDDDFLRLVESSEFGDDHAGVVFIAQDRRGGGTLVRRIHAALERSADRDLTGEVVYA